MGTHVRRLGGAGPVRQARTSVLLAAGAGLLTLLLAVAVEPLAWPPAGALTLVTAVLVVRRARVRHLLSAPGADTPAPKVRTELPSAIPDLIGRTADLTALLRLIEGGRRVVAVTGAAGLGKSALTVHFAREIQPLYPDGQLYADLGAGRGEPATPAAVLACLLAALGAPVEDQSGGTVALAARFRSRTAGRRIVLLLDDAADAEQVRPLLPAGPHCLALITSRSTLTDLPEATPFALGPLTEPGAVALLAAVAGPHRVAAEHPAARTIVRICGLRPLAVRLAATRSGSTLDDVAGRLGAEHARLDALHVDDLVVRAAFETRHLALDAADRHLFRSLGAYPGARISVRIAATAAGWARADARAGLERLVDAQLVEAVPPDGFRLHALVQRFAAERHERDAAPAVRRAALERVLAAYPQEDGHDQATASLLVRAGVREGLHPAAYRLAITADGWAGDRAGQLPRVAMWAAVLDAARRAGENDWTARALRGLGCAYRHEGRHDRAVDHLRMSVAVQQQAGGPRGEQRAEQVETRRLLGEALRGAGRYEEALREFRAALDASRALCGPSGGTAILRSLGALHLDRRRPDEAIACLEPVVAALPRCPDAERNLGAAYVRTGDLTAAERWLRSALAVYRQHGRAVGEGRTLSELGHLEEQRGALGPGADHHRAALAVFARVGHGAGVADAAEAIGDNLLAQGDRVGADAQYRRAAEAHADLGDHVRESEVRRKLGAP